MRVDMHAHVLPELDHGSKNIEESVKQLTMAKVAKIDKIVATSHFYPHEESLDSFLNRREASLTLLKQAAADLYEYVIPAAEVLVCEGMEEMEGLEKLCIKDTNVIMLELPFSEITPKLWDTVNQIIKSEEFSVVFVHPDRYSYETVNKMLSLKCCVQVNAECVRSFKGRKILKKCIDSKKICGLGSDIHGTQIGYKYFNKCVKYLGEEAFTIFDRTGTLLGI